MNIKLNVFVVCLVVVNCANSADFNSVFKYVGELVSTDSSLSDKEKIEIAQKAFGVTDKTAQKKFLYGFFLDSYQPDSKAEQQIFDNLKKYEWFSSNLTAIYFSGELEKFLPSPDAKKLHRVTHDAIRNFISLVSNSLDNGYQIDSCRAYHPGIAYLAATGDNRFAFMGKQPSASIEELVNNTVQKISNLSVGEKALFLSGTPTHETRIIVDKISQDKFDCIVHDSAGMTIVAVKKCLQSTDILDKDFWRKLYSQKLSMSYSGSGFLSDKPSIDVSSVRSQTKATCHFRCLYSILKSEILSLFTDQDKATVEWHNFKVAFGEWLLVNRVSNDRDLQVLCAKKQKERESQLNLVSKIKSLIEQGQYDYLHDSFDRAIRLLTARYDGDENYITSQEKEIGKLQRLLAMHSVLIRKMQYAKIGGANFESFFKQAKNEHLEDFFVSYKNKQIVKGDLFYEQLMTEIDQSSSVNLPDLVKLKFYTATQGYDQAIRQFNRPYFHHPANANLNLDQLNKIIAILKNQPGLLSDLVLKPNLFIVIYQAFMHGMIDEVASLYNALSEDDRKTFEEFSLAYASRAFLSIDFEKILEIYSNHDKYPKFFIWAILPSLTQGEIPKESIPKLLATMDAMAQKFKYTYDIVKVYSNILKLLLGKIGVDNEVDVLAVERALKGLRDDIITYSVSNDNKSDLIDVFEPLINNLLGLGSVKVRVYLEEISYKLFKQEVVNTISNKDNLAL